MGLRLRACGEHHRRLDSVGINVYPVALYRRQVISGVLGGIGGFAYIIYRRFTTWNFEVGVAGAGSHGSSNAIFDSGSCTDRSCACVLAVFRSLANIADSRFCPPFGWSKNIYSMMPFIPSMIILGL